MLDRLDFTGELWLSAGPGGWTFVTLPPACADQIRFFIGSRMGRAWGMIKVKARIGAAEWSTTIWPDKASGSFLLPVKAAVRKKEKIAAGDNVDVSLWLQVPPGF
ncbi:DUF1905 domain-containing protein [Roseibium sp. FZY0029]|uniref:DUF1905 domain-containing protein n=1 Tax=Roseibium sp. FZY0029 TaxID=3116647 RepID=UPI002EA4C6F8|nr:DUF1905 domain-containing protein [Roseibium sp. FZY0029]